MFSKFADAISRSPSLRRCRPNSILLWPANTQTSPMRILSKVKVASFPLTVISRGLVLASIAGNVTFQLLSFAATADSSFPSNVTVTFSPGFAVPQTGIGLSRCKTIFDWNKLWTKSPSLAIGRSTLSSPLTSSASSAARAVIPEKMIETTSTKQLNLFIYFLLFYSSRTSDISPT